MAFDVTASTYSSVRLCELEIVRLQSTAACINLEVWDAAFLEAFSKSINKRDRAVLLDEDLLCNMDVRTMQCALSSISGRNKTVAVVIPNFWKRLRWTLLSKKGVSNNIRYFSNARMAGEWLQSLAVDPCNSLLD